MSVAWPAMPALGEPSCSPIARSEALAPLSSRARACSRSHSVLSACVFPPTTDESMTPRRTLPMIALTVLALCALFATSANAELARQARADATASAFRAAKENIPVRDPGPPPGAQVLNYKFGPMRIQPGQNLINVDLQKERPDVNGYIVGFRPGLVYADNGKSPS